MTEHFTHHAAFSILFVILAVAHGAIGFYFNTVLYLILSLMAADSHYRRQRKL